MKIIKLERLSLVEKNNEIKAYVYIKNRRTGKGVPLFEWIKTFHISQIDLSLWLPYAIGYNYVSETVRSAREGIEAELRYLWDGYDCSARPVFVYYCFGMPIPQSLSIKKSKALLGSWHNTTPDEGNLTYSLDNRLQGIAFDNDRRITKKMVTKVYSRDPFTIIGVCEAKYWQGCLQLCEEEVSKEIEQQGEKPWKR